VLILTAHRVVRRYSKGEVDKAGRILLEWSKNYELFDELPWAIDVLTHWRQLHGYPINTFQATLRHRLKSIDENALVAQRLKRLPSIIAKMKRFPKMKLSRMQDIGGLRAVVSKMEHVERLYNSYKSKKLTHDLVGEKDYIAHPKDSGYRSIHLIYKYYKNQPIDYNGLYIELQIRTRLQHAWATAVETMGTFLNTPLKASIGPEEWLRFFSLTSSAFAHIEEAPLVPGYENLNRKETFEMLISEEKKLRLRETLSTFTVAANSIISDRKRGTYYLLVLDPLKKEVTLTSFSRERLEEATEQYKIAEQEAQGNDTQVVLVSAESIDSLRKAYPNYFLDTHEFISHIDAIEKELELIKKK